MKIQSENVNLFFFLRKQKCVEFYKQQLTSIMRKKKTKKTPQNKEKDNTKGEKVLIETEVTHICNKGTLGMEMKL